MVNRPEIPTEPVIEPLAQFLEIAAALSGSFDLQELLDLILTKSREITKSDAGSIYLVDRSDGFDKLLFKTAQNASRPDISFEEFAIPLTRDSLAGYVAITGETLNLTDAYESSPDVPYRLNRNFDLDIGYYTKSVLVLPMQDRKGGTLGVLQLINRKKNAETILTPENLLDETLSYSQQEERISLLLASQAGLSIERQNLLEDIENLFEGFVTSSISVIEARDPSTSGHSERVAALTVRLAEEVSSVKRGILRDTNFSRQQLKEIRYASLLHDFGKIGVPEAILVKCQKLHPDRLEVLRQRFGVARRTLELECAQNKYRHLIEHPHHIAEHPAGEDCPHCASLHAIDQQLSQNLAMLDTYWNIVEEANSPQVLGEDTIAQLKAMSVFYYRDLDGTETPLLSDDDLENLLVARGNLTEAERRAIEAHVTHSYQFLQRIPWTPDLAAIPEIAYAHHEKLDGTGYPRGLKQEQIPLQTQMMSICDVFDALTAGDRPYKKSMSLTKSFEILRQEADHFKLRGDLLDVFEQRQVFKVLGISENDTEV
ncbi:MAG: GAF domain-containing protein [Coleofasciculaceae cyanobacterium RL_1_1]|nr:GAF domain-containing protein [Coleofasciculaceae cyanobacterium RL_1_1]